MPTYFNEQRIKTYQALSNTWGISPNVKICWYPTPAQNTENLKIFRNIQRYVMLQCQRKSQSFIIDQSLQTHQ